jgi:hypothetical protein
MTLLKENPKKRQHDGQIKLQADIKVSQLF